MSKASEAERVDAWRADQYLRWGFEPEQVAELVEWGVDSGDVWKLVEVGCPPATALRIMRPLEDKSTLPLVDQAEQYSVKV